MISSVFGLRSELIRSRRLYLKNRDGRKGSRGGHGGHGGTECVLHCLRTLLLKGMAFFILSFCPAVATLHVDPVPKSEGVRWSTGRNCTPDRRAKLPPCPPWPPCDDSFCFRLPTEGGKDLWRAGVKGEATCETAPRTRTRTSSRMISSLPEVLARITRPALSLVTFLRSTGLESITFPDSFSQPLPGEPTQAGSGASFPV
jgi:hypothetical protein